MSVTLVLLPAMCPPHIRDRRVSGRPSHVAKLRSEFDAGKLLYARVLQRALADRSGMTCRC